MGSHAMTNVSFPAFSKNSAKKKRASRLARLKKNKLEVRREQLLSQVKYKGNKVDSNEKGGSPPPPHCTGKTIKGREFGEDLHRGIREREHQMARVHPDLESETLTTSGCSIRGNIWHYESDRDSSISSSGCRISCCSGAVSEEETDDGCLDNWEDIADLLTTRTSSGSQHAPKKSPVIFKPETNGISDSSRVVGNKDTGSSPFDTRAAPPQSRGSCRAWSLDDACRPQNLPNISKQDQIVHGAKVWPWQSLMPQPSSCPVCCEDFDVTDSRFLPCPCGFRLCLFCHKRIVESDGRCPGCRKQYDSGYYSSGLCVEPTQFQTASSCSTNVGINRSREHNSFSLPISSSNC